MTKALLTPVNARGKRIRFDGQDAVHVQAGDPEIEKVYPFCFDDVDGQ